LVFDAAGNPAAATQPVVDKRLSVYLRPP